MPESKLTSFGPKDRSGGPSRITNESQGTPGGDTSPHKKPQSAKAEAKNPHARCPHYLARVELKDQLR